MKEEVEKITPKEIRAHFAAEYNSSPHPLTSWDFRRLKKSGYCCDQCDASIFGMDDFPEISADGVYCEDCYKELFFDYCHICEDSYVKPKKPADTYFVVSKKSEDEVGVKAGFYQVKRYPYFYAALCFGFKGLFEENIKLLKECDVNSMLMKIQVCNYDKVSAGECCPACAKKYTGITPLANNYPNKRRGEKLIREHTKIIAQGH